MDRRYTFFVVVLVGIGIATAVALVFANWLEAQQDDSSQAACAAAPHPATGVSSSVLRTTDGKQLCIWLDQSGRQVQVTTLP